MKPSLHALARFIADDHFAQHHADASADARMALVTRIETALRSVVDEERDACAALCDERQGLWQRTEDAPEKPAALRSEARARSVEAAWLADAIRVRGDH